MTVGGLLEAFDLLGDSSEVIQKLRKLAVGLAITGRLKSDDEESCATRALVRMVCEDAPVISETTANRSRTTGLSPVNLLFGRERSHFLDLGSIARIEKGQTGIMRAKPGPYPLVVTAEERASCDHFDFDGAAAIVPLVSSAGHGKASLQRLHYQEGKFALGSILAAIFPREPNLISARFIYEYLSAFKAELLVSRMIGTANVSLSVRKVSEVPMPIVGAAVQRKLCQLMNLCDGLEAIRSERQVARERFTTATFARVNVPDPDPLVSSTHARFMLRALPALTGDVEQVKQLRQTILNLAVRGKLVPQDPNDKPVITDEYSVERSPIRRHVPLRVEKPPNVNEWSLPPSWICLSAAEMLRRGILLDLKDGNHGANHPKVAEFSDLGVPFITAVQVRNHTLDLSDAYKLRGEALRRLRIGFAKAQDGIFTHKATVGRVAICPEDYILSPQTTYYRPNSAVLSNRYLMWFMESSAFAQQVDAVKKQTTRDFVSIGKQYMFFHAIPPLAEQHSIAGKVDELMHLCDRLEANITLANDTRHHLLDSLLADALIPTKTDTAKETPRTAVN